MCVCVYVYVCVCLYVLRVCMCMCACIRMHVCVHACVLVLSGTNNLKSVRFLSWYCGMITVLYYICFWHAQCSSAMYMCM